LQWTADPSWEELLLVCELMFSFFRKSGSTGVTSGRQLAFRINKFRQTAAIKAYIQELLENDNKIDSADKAVETSLSFYRNWLTFNFPKMLVAIDKIQRDVLRRRGFMAGDFSTFAGQAENGFVSSELSALEEYGIPLQISNKIKSGLILGEGLDSTLSSLRDIDVDRYRLTRFEKRLLLDVARTST